MDLIVKLARRYKNILRDKISFIDNKKFPRRGIFCYNKSMQIDEEQLIKFILESKLISRADIDEAIKKAK